MAVTREMIEELVLKLNEAENNRSNTTVEDTVAAIDRVMAEDVEGWNPHGHVPDRETERQTERWLLESIPDYHRTILTKIIDPPYAAFNYIIKGTLSGSPFEIKGCSILECNEEGKIHRHWVYFDTAQMPRPTE
jgi:hypothetical protein